MFFFFIGGIEQRAGRILEAGVARCVNCGSKADLVEYERVLKMFFIPVWKWPGREPILHCKSCNLFQPSVFSDFTKNPSVMDLRCRSCDQPVERRFLFCPFCGSSL